jgi:hypothetical protein
MSMEDWWNDTEGETECSEGNMNSITLSKENNTLIGMKMSPGFRGESQKIFNVSKYTGTTGLKM